MPCRGICQMSAGAYQAGFDQFWGGRLRAYPILFCCIPRCAVRLCIRGLSGGGGSRQEAIKMLTSQTAGVDLSPKTGVDNAIPAKRGGASPMGGLERWRWAITPGAYEFQKRSNKNPISDLITIAADVTPLLKQYQAAIRTFSPLQPERTDGFPATQPRESVNAGRGVSGCAQRSACCYPTK